tara:strand:+ start:15635 stop:15868 length:234 start_codon:yes stop_codon:yes gene_type:complete
MNKQLLTIALVVLGTISAFSQTYYPWYNSEGTMYTTQTSATKVAFATGVTNPDVTGINTQTTTATITPTASGYKFHL